MATRNERREATRNQIIESALFVFSESSFDAVSTRMIASKAGVSQGLLTYHFKTKELLWREAANHLFMVLGKSMRDGLSSHNHENRLEFARENIRQIVYFNAKHPELLRFMLEVGKGSDDRTKWLVDTHIRPVYKNFSNLLEGVPAQFIPHAFYTMAGASGAIFNVPNECKRLTGVNPHSKTSVEMHADYLAYLMIPD